MHALHSTPLSIISDIVGWIYFLAWSFSFYPQVFENWRRKSVIGLSFDFLFFNITGFVSYTIYNVTLYWVDSVKDEYLEKHGPPLPINLNDVIFALHALALTSFTIFQCFIYERGDQRISFKTFVVMSATWVAISFMLILSGCELISDLVLVNFFSYVKLGVTFTKYVPQAWLNYKRKSTVGWSIGNILLDFTGGLFSLFQMLLDSINAGNFNIFVGDIAKLGLAIFSLGFDILFMVQHYALYPRWRGTVTFSSPEATFSVTDTATATASTISAAEDEEDVFTDQYQAQQRIPFLSTQQPLPTTRPRE
ncbi:Cystinosin [Balamuthia mandrillaris]